MENNNFLPRVGAVHALAGFGKCALTVAIPVISACGVEVCPVPTANLSTNTSFPGVQITDFTSHIDAYINHWKEIDLKLDGLYSGFLGSALQIDMVIKMKKQFNPKITVIDPVMGDDGVTFRSISPELCQKMKKLVSVADVITPNLTESCILTDTDYEAFDINKNSLEDMCQRLAKMGPRNVVITGVPMGDKILTAVYEAGNFFTIEQDKLPQSLHGTGDLFASILCAKLVKGRSLSESATIAAGFVCLAMEYSYTLEDCVKRNVCFEPLLHRLWEL